MRKPSPATVIATVALFVALGGVGIAANGQSLILGKSDNSATLKTGLSAPVNDKALQLTNTSTGTSATALGLTVASGHAPFTVSSQTRVANLNADKLDGIDSTGFLPKTGKAADSAKLGGQLPSYYLPATGKAADSDTLDGLDSTSFAPKAQEGWHQIGAPGEPAFEWCFCGGDELHPTWQNFGFGYNTAGFYRDSLGRVHLKGLVSLISGVSASCDQTAIFVLPVGYRPPATEIAATVHNDSNQLGRIDIRSDGWVTICTTSTSAAGEWWALDGISFRAA